MASFANRLKELRNSKGLTQKALAEAVGMSDTGLQNYELETRIPKADTVVKLAKFFNVSTDYLLGVIDEELLAGGNEKKINVDERS